MNLGYFIQFDNPIKHALGSENSLEAKRKAYVLFEKSDLRHLVGEAQSIRSDKSKKRIDGNQETKSMEVKGTL